MTRARSLGLACGRLPPGPRNLITDVPGVSVGHTTLVDGDIRTGVTAIRPHPGDVFRDRPVAAAHVLNGFGKSIGLMQVEELGQLETPILLTNTLSVGTCGTALIRRAIAQNPRIGRQTSTVNPVVCECNDGYLNDIQALAVTEAHALAALDAASTEFDVGA
ncbi:MAG: P1 family peptidase, partial [Actinomycetota bacterium]